MLLKDAVQKTRSKNAGPFWVSIDVFCGSEKAYAHVQKGLSTSAVASALSIPPEDIKRFDIPSLHTIKFSLPRATPQGARLDRDMHGAQFAHLVAGIEIPT